MNPLKKLAGDTAVYGASSIIGRLFNYFLFPLHTIVLGLAEYGIVTELYVMAAFLNVVYLFGMETAFFRFVNKYSDQSESTYNTAFSFVFAMVLIGSASLYLLDSEIVNFMGYYGKEHFIWIFAGILAVDALTAIPFARVRHENKPRLFAISKLSGIGTNIFLNIFFLLICYPISEGKILPEWAPFIDSFYNPDYNIEYIFASNLAASGISLLVINRYIRKIRLEWNRDLLKPMVKYAYPILFTGLALVTNEMLSRGALKYWLPENFYSRYSNQEILGIFGGVFKLAIPMNMAVQAFRYAAEPFFFSRAADKESPLLFSKVLSWFTIFGCLIWVGVSVNLELFKHLLGKEAYWTALNIVPLLLLGSLFMGINYNLSAWYKLIDKTKIGTSITIIGAFVTILGNYLLIPLYGYLGSAIAFILAYFSMSLISYIWSRSLNPFPYQIGKISSYILICGAILYAYYWFNLSGLPAIIYGNIIFLALILFTYFKEYRSINS